MAQIQDNGKDLKVILLNDPDFNINFNKLDSFNSTKKKVFISGKFDLTYSNTNVLTFWLSGQDNTSTLAINGLLNVNYQNKDKIWDNRVILGYGFTESRNLDFPKKTNDLIDINTSFAVRIKKKLYASSFSNIQTQFTKGYKYETVNNNQIRTLNSDAFSPLNFKIGIGVLWKDSKKKLKATLSPFTGFITFVNPKYTLEDGSYFGVLFGESQRVQFGANLELYNKLEFFEKTVLITNISNFYSDYLVNPENIYINNNLSVNIIIKKIFSLNYNLRAIYDHKTLASFQILQVSGIGISYSF